MQTTTIWLQAHTHTPRRKHERTFQGKTPAKTCSPVWENKKNK